MSDRLESLHKQLSFAVMPKSVLRLAVGIALEASDREGVSRAAVARRLGVTEQQVKNWSSGRSAPHADDLADMLLLRTILPAAARLALWSALARSAGLVVAPEGSGRADGRALQAKALEVSEAAGKLAAAVKNATRSDSPGGTLATTGELERIETEARHVEEEALGTRRMAARERTKRSDTRR